MPATKTPGRKMAILTGAAALTVVLFAVQMRPTEPVRHEEHRRKAIVTKSEIEVQSSQEVRSQVPPEEVKTSGSAVAAAAGEVRLTPPQGIEENNVHQLSAWLLSIPDAELKRALGTPSLDRWVGRVVDGYMALRPGEIGNPEIVDFLNRLNARILSVQS